MDAVRAAEPGDPVQTLLRWIDEDRKATPLKTIQGRIWAEGYAKGAFNGHVYPDAAQALRALACGRELKLFVYSSGSVEAQRLIFHHSDQGDLEPLFSGWFDTTTGPKREAASYEGASRRRSACRVRRFCSCRMCRPNWMRRARWRGWQTHVGRSRQGERGGVASFAEIDLSV